MSPRCLAFVLFVAVAVSLPVIPVWGQLSYEGSTSIGQGLMPALAKAFTNRTRISFNDIRPTSSKEGFIAVREGKAILGGLSRLMTKDELEAGLANRVIGYDALVVYVHKQNPLTTLTLPQIKGVFGGTIGNWQELGGPPLPIITLHRHGETGGVVGQFREVVMAGEMLATPSFAFPSHQENIEYVADNPAAITFAALAGDRGLARILAIDGALPSQESFKMGSYPLGRPFTLCYREDPKNSDLTQFIDFVFSPEGQAIVKNYVVPVLDFD